jgi:hypothetical protein
MRNIDWITSAKPAVDRKKFLEQNSLLVDFTHTDCNLLVVNSFLEVDGLASVKNFSELRLVESKRPTLYDLLNLSDADTCILSNSDIRVFSNKLISDIVNKEASLSVCRRFDVEFLDSKFIKNYTDAKKITKLFGYQQSRFTVDLFIISRGFREHLLRQVWISDYCLGQAGVDMMILKEAYRFGTVERIDQHIFLLHRNHESFKIAMPVNIIVNMIGNRKFSKKRSTVYHGEPSSMIFANLPQIFERSPFLRRVILRLDMRTVRFRNQFQYLWSRINFSYARRLINKGQKVRLVTVKGLWFFVKTDVNEKSLEININTIRQDLYCRYGKHLKR